MVYGLGMIDCIESQARLIDPKRLVDTSLPFGASGEVDVALDGTAF